MGKTYDNRAFAKVQEYYLFNRIFSSVDPMQELDNELNNLESILFEVIDQERISQLRELILTRLQDGVKELQKRIRNGEESEKLQEEMKKILTIQRRLHKNSQYKKQVGSGFGPIYLGLLVWSSKMVLSEETLRIISEFSFDKSLKLYYYYFKYYMSHLNLYFPEQNKIKDLFIPNPTFNFGFFSHLQNRDQSLSQRSGGQSQKFIISIQDIRKYFSDNGLIKGLNHFTAASLINNKYNLGLSQDDEIFHALMVKIKIVLTEDRNSLVRSVLYSDWIFGFFQIQEIQSGKKPIGLPQIFELPPDYSRILQQQIQLFFIPSASPETHLASLSYIDAMLSLQQKRGQRQFNLSLNENTEGLIKILESLISSISKDDHSETEMINQKDKQKQFQIPLESLKNKELIEKIFYIIKRQITQATQIHSLAEQLATLIFTKKHIFEVTEKTIQHCGSILIAVEADEEQILNYSIQQIKQHKNTASHSYLKVINSFFQTKQRRQRRDFGSIARSISESALFPILKQIVKEQLHQSTLYNLKSISNTVMELIGNICSENPTLIDIITKYQILDILLEFLVRVQKINNYECVSNAINFIHYICLKEGQVRAKVLSKYLQPFIRKISCSNMSEYINYKNYTYITSLLLKFIGNIKNSYFYIYLGFTSALKDLTNYSKNLPNFEYITQSLNKITQEHLAFIEKQTLFDLKLIILLKLIEKTKEQFLIKLRPSWLNIMKRRLLKILFVRNNTLLDFPGQARLAINIVHEIRTIFDKKKKRSEQENLQILSNEINGEQIEDQGQQQVEGQVEVQRQRQRLIQPEELIQNNQHILRQKQRQDDEKFGQLMSIKSSSYRSEMQQMGFVQQNQQKQKEREKQREKDNKQEDQKQKPKFRSFSIVAGQSNQIPPIKYQHAIKAINENNTLQKTISLQKQKQRQQQKMQKQLHFLRYQIRCITKKLKQIFKNQKYHLTKSPRKIYEIISSEYAKNNSQMNLMEEEPSVNIVTELKITIYIAKLDRLLYYLTKQLQEKYCSQYEYHDIALTVYELLPYFTEIITLINDEFLWKNLPFLKRITQKQLLIQRQMVNYISSKRLIHELNLKQKEKIMYYHEFIQNFMRTLAPLISKHDQKYIIIHLDAVVMPYIKYAVKIINEIKRKQVQENRECLSTLECFHLKNMQRNIQELFCLYKVKQPKLPMYKPYNRILMYYIIKYSHTEGYKNGSLNIFNLFMEMISLIQKHGKKELQQYKATNNLYKSIQIQQQKETDVDKIYPLIDNTINRSVMIKRIILKCLRQSVKQFIEGAFVMKLQTKIESEAQRLITQQLNQPNNGQQNVIDLEIVSKENELGVQQERKQKQFLAKYQQKYDKYVELNAVPTQEDKKNNNQMDIKQLRQQNQHQQQQKQQVKVISTSNIIKKIKKQCQNAFLYTLYTLYKQYTNLRIKLQFNQSKSIINMNNIRRVIPKIYKYVDNIKQYIKNITQSGIQYQLDMIFSHQLINQHNVINTDQFNQYMEHNYKHIYYWIIQHLDKEITKEDFIILSLADDYIDIKQTEDIGDKGQRMKLFSFKYHQQLCKQILLISNRLFDNFIIDWKLPKKKNKIMSKHIQQKLQEQKKLNKPISIKEQVIKIANICQIFSKQTQTFLNLGFYSEGDPKYTNGFVTQLVKFITEVIGNYQVAQGEDKFQEEANLLSRRIIQFLKVYFEYAYNLDEQKKKQKKQKRKKLQNIKRNKNQIKKSKNERRRLRRSKNQDHQSVNLESQLSRQVGLSAQKNNEEQRQLKRDHSMLNLNNPVQRLETPRQMPRSSSHRKKVPTMKIFQKKTFQQSIRVVELKNKIKKKSKSKQKLSKSIQTLLCNILAASQIVPFLKNQTLHIISDFIMSHLTQSTGFKYIELDICQILPILLRVRICENKHEGYFHKLSRIGVMLLSGVQSHVNRQIGIKRLFFQNNSREINIKQFSRRIGKFQQIGSHLNSFSYFLQIKKPKPIKKFIVVSQEIDQNQPEFSTIKIPKNDNKSDKKKDKNKQQKNEEYQFVEFNRENYKNNKNEKNVFVVLLPHADYNTINYNLNHKGYFQNHIQTTYNVQQQYPNSFNLSNLKDKQKQKQKEREKQKQYHPIKTVEYTPNKKIQMFIYEIIKNIVRLIVRNMEEANSQNQSQGMTEEEPQVQNNIKTDIFKIITLISVLEFLIRQSPCLSPYVTKYKCWKMITQSMQGMSLKPRAMLSKLLNLQNKKQITFLALLIRAVSVLTFNTNFQILFSMCLDNTVIQKQKIISNQAQQSINNITHQEVSLKPETKELNKNQPISKPAQQDQHISYVTFAHVVRLKALNQIQQIIFSKDQSFIRKFLLINLLTKLLTIRQFCKQCIQTHNFIKNLSKNYTQIMNLMKQKSFPQVSVIGKKILIPFYVNPVSILVEINISLQLNKKQSKRPKILMKLTTQSIDSQLIAHTEFIQTKFKQNWPYTTASQMNFGLQEEDIDNYESSSSSGDDDDDELGEESDSQIAEGQLQLEDFLHQAHNQMIPQASDQQQGQSDGEQSQHYDQFTNSWINHDTILDDLIGNQEIVQEDHQEDSQNDIDGNRYPRQDDQINEDDEQILEIQDDDLEDLQQNDEEQSQELGEQGDYSSYSAISSADIGNQIQLQLVPGQIHDSLRELENQSRSSLSEPNNELFESENLAQIPKIFYSYLHKNMQIRRLDPRNFILKTQRLQDQLIQLLQAIYLKFIKTKSLKKNKVKSKREEDQQVNQYLYSKYKKIDSQEHYQIEDHQKCIKYFLDNIELINYSNYTEYNSYGKYKEYQWQAPPPQRYGEDKPEDNPYANEDIIQDNIDLNTMMRGMSRIGVRNRRNAVIIGDNTNERTFLEDLRQRNNTGLLFADEPARNQLQVSQSQQNPQEDDGVDQNQLNVPLQLMPQDQGEEIEDLEELMGEGEHNVEINWDPVGIQNDFFRRMSNEEISQALQRQGFSYEDFRNFPREIQADILQNIQEQNTVNQQLQRRNTRNDRGNQINPQQGAHLLAEPNTPIHQPIHLSQNSPRPANLSHQPAQVNLQISLPQPQSSRVLGQAQNNQQEHSEHYKKLANHHIKKINKDIIHLLNKQNKSCIKYFEMSQQFIQSLLDLVYIMTDNDFIYFPFNLLASLCVNPHNQTRILSNLITILIQGPAYKEVPNKMPYTRYTNNQNQLIVNYLKYGYINISLKILYILLNLSKSYNVSISMLYNQGKTTSRMNRTGVQQMLNQNTLLQNLMSLLKFEVIKQSAINLQYLLSIIKNVTVIKFNYHIHSIVTGKDKIKQEKQKLANINKTQRMEQIKQGQAQKQKQKEKVDRSKDASLTLTEQNTSLLFSLLEGDFLRQNAQHISKIIMRLSLDEKNLSSFIHFFKKVIRSLAQKITKSFIETYQKSSKHESIPHRLSYRDKIYKSHEQPLIVRLMLIFYQIIKSMKRSVSLEQKYISLLEQFRTILECEQIKQLCERGCQIIQKNPSSPQIMPRIHQFIDCFFAIFNILQDNQQPMNKQLQKKQPKIPKAIQTAQSNKKPLLKRKFTSNIINLEQLFEKKLCTPQGRAFINANIRNKLNSALKGRRFKESLLGSPIILVALETPHMLQFDNKKSLFKVQIRRLKHKKPYGTVNMMIDRKDVFHQSFEQFMNRKADDLKGKLKIQFEGQEGQDVGGLTRQWFQLLSKQMFNPNYALFIPSSTGSTYQPYSKSYVNGDHLKFFKFIGRIMGKALHDGFMLDAYFTPAFYKHILGQPISWKDMEEEDFEFYKSLKWILQNSPIQDLMELNFTYQFDNFGEIKNQNLVPNGDQILVTQENKIQYVHLISQAKMSQSVQKQYENLLQGFHEFIPPKIIRIFDQKQLEIMISGLPTIDIEDLRNNTDLVSYNKTDQVIIWLFQLLEEFDMGLRTAFLQFVTGTSRVPSEGFKALQGYNGHQKFNIHKYYDVKHLPRSHTCFNQLDLPPYESKEILRQKLTLAITEGKQGFGIL